MSKSKAETYADLRSWANKAAAHQETPVTTDGPADAVVFLFRLSPALVLQMLDDLDQAAKLAAKAVHRYVDQSGYVHATESEITAAITKELTHE